MNSPHYAAMVERLLTELCVDLGFCLSPADQMKLQNGPQQGVDGFTDAVLMAEGLNPAFEKQLRRRVRILVDRHFKNSGM